LRTLSAIEVAIVKLLDAIGSTIAAIDPGNVLTELLDRVDFIDGKLGLDKPLGPELLHKRVAGFASIDSLRAKRFAWRF
jgi:hypothetical protein